MIINILYFYYYFILIWVFILFAWINNKYAKINLYIIIPLIFILHLLPIHILTEIKKNMYQDSYKIKIKNINDKTIPYFNESRDFLQKNCFQNPLSPQGLLINIILFNKQIMKPHRIKKYFLINLYFLSPQLLFELFYSSLQNNHISL